MKKLESIGRSPLGKKLTCDLFGSSMFAVACAVAAMPSKWHVVYRATGKTSKFHTTRYYVGCVEVDDTSEFSVNAALQRRKAQHQGLEQGGAAWLKICNDIAIEAIKISNDPYVDELIEFVKQFQRLKFSVRGACFSERVLDRGVEDLIDRIPHEPELIRKMEEPVIVRHLQGLCFYCGLSSHFARSCSSRAGGKSSGSGDKACASDAHCEAHLKARRDFLAALIKGPAEFQHPGGPHWNAPRTR